MKRTPILAALAAAALTAACTNTKAAGTSIVCQATVTDAAGTTVATLQDTVVVQVSTTTGASGTVADSVGGDPTPCKVASHANGYMVLNGKDSVTGNPTK